MAFSNEQLMEMIALSLEMERERGFTSNGNAREIAYIDTAPKPFVVQIPLVEYFERVKRLKARPLAERLLPSPSNRRR